MDLNFDDLIFGTPKPQNGAENASTPPIALSSTEPWPSRLAFDIALGLDDDEELMERYGLTVLEYDALKRNVTFRREIASYLKDIRDNGITFKAKAKLQAEEYLVNLHDLISDPSVAASVRLEAIKSVVRWAGHEPKDNAVAQNQSNQPQFNIQINL